MYVQTRQQGSIVIISYSVIKTVSLGRKTWIQVPLHAMGIGIDISPMFFLLVCFVVLVFCLLFCLFFLKHRAMRYPKQQVKTYVIKGSFPVTQAEHSLVHLVINTLLEILPHLPQLPKSSLAQHYPPSLPTHPTSPSICLQRILQAGAWKFRPNRASRMYASPE